jgi:hypothetical protein
VCSPSMYYSLATGAAYGNRFANRDVSPRRMYQISSTIPVPPAAGSGVAGGLDVATSILYDPPKNLWGPFSSYSPAIDGVWTIGYAVTIVDINRRNAAPPGLCNGTGGVQGVGNPIYPLYGTKRETLSTGFTIGRHQLQFAYDSNSAVAKPVGGQFPEN